MATRKCFDRLDRDSASGQALMDFNATASRNPPCAEAEKVSVYKMGRAPLIHRSNGALLQVGNIGQSGYVTTAVVSILALLSLLTTRVTIGVTVDAYRVAGTNQGLASIVYAGELALKDSVTRISNNLSELTGNPSCFNHDFGSITVTDDDTGLSRDYQMTYSAEFIEARNSRDLYRVYATAEASIFKTTVSQIASIDASAGTVYLLLGTWSNTLPICT